MTVNKTENNDVSWGTSVRCSDSASCKLQSNVLCFVNITGEINKSRFGACNFTRLVTIVFVNKTTMLHVTIPRVYNGEGECQTVPYAVKNEPVKCYGLVQMTQ